MKEFIEKLIERLEEVYQTQEQEYTKFFDREGMNCIFDRADIECARVSGMRKMLEIAKEFKNEYYANTPQKSAGGWIPVTERLPEHKTNVLICCGEFVYYALFEYGHFSNDYGLWYKSVTHWQPLPEPYKSGKSEKAEWKEAVMNHFTKIE